MMRSIQLHRLCFYALVFFIPVQLGYHFWPSFSFVQGIRIDYLSPTIYATDVLIVILTISWIFSFRKKHLSHLLKKHKKSMLITAAVLIALATNSFFATSPFLALYKSFTFLKLLILFFYIIYTKPPFDIITLFLFIAGVYSGSIALIQLMKQSSIGGLMWFLGERTFTPATPGIATIEIHGKIMLRPYATFPHPNVLAGFLIIIFPLFFSLLVRKKCHPALLIFFSSFFIVTIIATESRSAWIVGIITAGIFFLKRSYSSYKFLSAKLTQFVFFIVLVAIVLYAFPFISERLYELLSYNSQSVSKRIYLMKIAYYIIRDNLFFGVGLGNFIPAINSYSSIASYQDLQPVHNIYLLFLAETGMIGGVFLLIFLYTIINMIIAKPSHPLHLSLISILLLGLFDHYIYTIHQTQILMSILTGYAVLLNNKYKRKKISNL